MTFKKLTFTIFIVLGFFSNVEKCYSTFCGHPKGGFLDDKYIVGINKLLQSVGNYSIDGRSLVTIHRKLYVNGIMVHSRANQNSKRNLYTVEFHDGDTISFGYVELLIANRVKQYAVIQKFALEEWRICVPQENGLSDIFSRFGDLQELLGKHCIPVSKTDNLIAVSVDSIVDQVVCIKMHSSSVLYLAPMPNTLECD